MGTFAQPLVEKRSPVLPGRLNWGKVQAPSQSFPLPPAPLPLLTRYLSPSLYLSDVHLERAMSETSLEKIGSLRLRAGCLRL